MTLLCYYWPYSYQKGTDKSPNCTRECVINYTDNNNNNTIIIIITVSKGKYIIYIRL